MVLHFAVLFRFYLLFVVRPHLLCFLNNTDDDDDNDDLTHLGRKLETTTIMHISRSTESF